VRHTIHIGGYQEDVAVDPTGRKAWVGVSSRHGHRFHLTPVDLRTGRRGTPLAVGADAHALALTPDGSRAYVASVDTNQLIPVDLVTRRVLPPIALPAAPWDLELTADGTTAVVTCPFDDTVLVVHPGDGTVAPAISMDEPRGVDIDDAGHTAYVTTPRGVAPINLVTRTAGTTVDLGGEVQDVVVAPAPPLEVTPRAPAPSATTAVAPQFTG
jgi:DNA-binding beta-propeller fold protein YncE